MSIFVYKVISPLEGCHVSPLGFLFEINLNLLFPNTCHFLLIYNFIYIDLNLVTLNILPTNFG